MNIHLRLANYISRYAPSRAKVTAYLMKKNVSDIDELLTEMWYDEDMMMEMWMRTFLNTGKSKHEMKIKLLTKLFDREKIEKKIEKFSEEIIDWQNYEETIRRTIDNKIQKWKSKNNIKMELIQKFPYFKDEIIEIIEWTSDNSGLRKEIEKYRKKYNLTDRNEMQKFYQAILRKWFQYRDVKAILDEENL